MRQLRKNGLFCDVLEIVKIGISYTRIWNFDPSISIFITPQQNNLHTLSLKYCKLSSEATSSLIRSLQSPHCRLHKLVLTGSYCECQLLITIIITKQTIFSQLSLLTVYDLSQLQSTIVSSRMTHYDNQIGLYEQNRIFTLYHSRGASLAVKPLVTHPLSECVCVVTKGNSTLTQ